MQRLRLVSSARPPLRPIGTKRASFLDLASVKKSRLSARTVLGLTLFALLAGSAFVIFVYAVANYRPPVERHVEIDDSPRVETP